MYSCTRTSTGTTTLVAQYNVHVLDLVVPVLWYGTVLDLVLASTCTSTVHVLLVHVPVLYMY